MLKITALPILLLITISLLYSRTVNECLSLYRADTLPLLREINLSGFDIEKLENMEALSNAVHLNLDYNRISKIEGLDKLNKLLVLNLAGNRISNIENLEGLNSLRILILSGNLIEKIEKIETLTNLLRIGFYNNPVKSVSFEAYRFLKTNNIAVDIDNRTAKDIDAFLSKYRIPVPVDPNITNQKPKTETVIVNTNG